MTALAKALPPAGARFGGLRQSLFGTPARSALTAVVVVAVMLFLPRLIDWALLSAVWRDPDGAACRALQGAGACWAVIAEKHRIILFGLYPYAEHWRPLLALAIYVVVLGVSSQQTFWSWRILLPLWILGAAAIVVLMRGGVFGLTYVETRQWGGLPLTIVLFTGTVAAGFPVAVLLALGRRSEMVVVRTLAVVTIESVRAVPLITILFFASIMFPLFLPRGITIDQLVRAGLCMALFFACYEAEVIRGGLQAIPRGQYEAADSLGLSYWQKMRRIVLPQALRIAIPGMMNYVILAFKNTTLVVVIGIFDILTATNAALTDPNWRRFFTEAYAFVALIFFCFCFAMSKYSQYLERRLDVARRI